jgi:peroxiredoxin
MAMPVLEHLHKKFSPTGFRVIGMSVDDSSSIDDIQPLIKKLGVTYTITTSKDFNAATRSKYNAEGIPSQFLIDKKGVVRWSQAGFSEVEGDQLDSLIKKLQKE